MLALAWPAAIAFCPVAALTRYSSLAGLIAGAATPFILWGLDQLPEAKLFALLTVLLWIMHGASISRLIAGTEGKMGKPAGVAPPS
jgi:acyl phosphate:glycerol-3-phosphate acyltransferase